uniref:Uncharacterized protein n=1 Tax=Arion vulgaris TaxID=1028688 RepID=A0A0B6ZIP5_9EUPU
MQCFQYCLLGFWITTFCCGVSIRYRIYKLLWKGKVKLETPINMKCKIIEYPFLSQAFIKS